MGKGDILRKTKIIATLRSQNLTKSQIDKLFMAGVNIVRINMSHQYDVNETKQLVELIRKQSQEHQKHIGILMDLGGPKIRVSQKIQKKGIPIEANKTYTIGSSETDIPLSIPISFTEITENSQVKIDDGKITFKVESSSSQGNLELIAQSDGDILPGKGVNFPGVCLDVPSLTEKDIQDLKLGLDLNVDWFALSFVRQALDMFEIDTIFDEKKKRRPVLAKIEKPEAIDNLDEIIHRFDGILIARGDLGVEMPLEQVPILQKKIIRQCNQFGKPVITATQMLESMIENPIPTRAEVNDIATAIYDGTDAVMLSGETAVGKYPVESVKTMASVIENVEKEISKTGGFQQIPPESFEQDTKSAICHAAYEIATDLNIPVIVIMTESGSTALEISRYRPNSYIIALCPFEQVCCQLELVWGIKTFKVEELKTIDEMIQYAESKLLKENLIEAGQSFILSAGVPVGVPGSTNTIKIHKVRKAKSRNDKIIES